MVDNGQSEEVDPIDETDDDGDGEDELTEGKKLSDSGVNAKKIQKEQRIEQVRRLMLRGVKKGYELQGHMKRMGFDLTMRSIYRYKSIIIRRNQKKLMERGELYKTVEEIAASLREQLEEVMRELWVVYHNKTVVHKVRCECGREHEQTITINNSSKVNALRTIKEVQKDYVDIMQSLGMIYKEPEKHQVLDAEGNPIDPTAINKQVLNTQFISFINARFKDPLGLEAANDKKHG